MHFNLTSEPERWVTFVTCSRMNTKGVFGALSLVITVSDYYSL